MMYEGLNYAFILPDMVSPEYNEEVHNKLNDILETLEPGKRAYKIKMFKQRLLEGKYKGEA